MTKLTSELDDRIRLMVADEVATAPAPPTVQEIEALGVLAAGFTPRNDHRRPSRFVVAGIALAAAAALVAAFVVVRETTQTTEATETSPTVPGPVAAPSGHLLPESMPDGLVLAEAGDVADPQPFGEPVTSQVFTRPDGAFLRLAVDPWHEDLALSHGPVLGLDGFESVTARGEEGGWRNQTLGYGLLWFRVGGLGGTRVVAQTSGLSVTEAVAVADSLVVRAGGPTAGFDAPPGLYRLSAEVLTTDTDRPLGTTSYVTWLGPGQTTQVELVTMVGDAREAWRLLLDGSGELVQIGARTVLQTTLYGRATAIWVEGGTVYRLSAVGDDVVAQLPSILRSLRTVDVATWRRAVEDGNAQMASWETTSSAQIGQTRVSIHRRAGGFPKAMCVSGSTAGDRCQLSLRTLDPTSASVLVDGIWWVVGVGPLERPQATVLPDRGRAVIEDTTGDGRWWFASQLSNDATSVTYSIGGDLGTSGTYGRPLS